MLGQRNSLTPPDTTDDEFGRREIWRVLVNSLGTEWRVFGKLNAFDPNQKTFKFKIFSLCILNDRKQKFICSLLKTVICLSFEYLVSKFDSVHVRTYKHTVTTIWSVIDDIFSIFTLFLNKLKVQTNLYNEYLIKILDQITFFTFFMRKFFRIFLCRPFTALFIFWFQLKGLPIAWSSSSGLVTPPAVKGGSSLYSKGISGTPRMGKGILSRMPKRFAVRSSLHILTREWSAWGNNGGYGSFESSTEMVLKSSWIRLRASGSTHSFASYLLGIFSAFVHTCINCSFIGWFMYTYYIYT